MNHLSKKSFAIALFLLLAGIRSGFGQDPLVAQLKKEWEGTRKQMVDIAAAMPEEKFQYRATPEVRTYGEIVAHVAGENLMWLEYLEGKGKAGSNERYDQLKDRKEILKVLTDSFDYGTKLLASLNDQKAMENVSFVRGQMARWAIVIHAVEHCKEHYGNLVTYLRLNQIVPPSTASRPPGA